VTSLAQQVNKVQVLYPIAKAILSRLTTCVFSKTENWHVFCVSPGINFSTVTQSITKFSYTVDVLLAAIPRGYQEPV